ncbi:MAG: thioredoxin family protein [Candidatus Sumerlaeia bacterium]
MSENERAKSAGIGVGAKIGIVAALAVLVALTIYAKSQGGAPEAKPEAVETVAATPAPAETPRAVPKLLELGGEKCIPCKMMAPIIDELRAENKGKLDVVFIDVLKNREVGNAYNISTIPTQIFIAADGKELFRHEGVFSKDEIRAKWAEFGVTIAADSQTTGTAQ